jgi:outer membrane protein assembly factor BamE (lipoprotein component of BamABCDE complex)
MRRIPAVAAVLMIVAGCTMPRQKMAEVQVGMTRPQVVAILGEPDSAEARDGQTALIYSFWRDFWSRRPGDYSDRYYVRFDRDGRVDAFGLYTLRE